MRFRLIVAFGLLGMTAVSCRRQSPVPQDQADVSFRHARGLAELMSPGQPVISETVVRAAFMPARPTVWTPQVNTERPRGGIDVYASAAPAVVVVRTNDGHGSGFFVNADGLLVTNHHVVATGLNQARDGSSATVHLGSLASTGLVELSGMTVRAMLYKVDRINDLAALKLERPAGAAPLPFIKLSATPPRPGQDCAIIGHPASGMLWTFRPCQVSSIGEFPRDMVNLVMSRLAAAGQQRAEIETIVKNMPARRIMLTSAQANPGDSGGPVLDKDGALIGVTFGGPGDRDQDKFTYHVHIDEVRRFIAQIPPTPMVLPPDPWSNLPSNLAVRDLDGDRKADVLAAAGAQRAEVLLFDLDNDTPPALVASQAALAQLIDQEKWDFEAAIDLRGSGYIAYYDVDNDGSYDLVLQTDEDSPSAKEVFARQADGRWTFQPASGQRIIAGSHLKNAELGRKLEALISAMR